jgi:cation diffusion facilitator CzcD-associated flavoprotein CzcO
VTVPARSPRVAIIGAGMSGLCMAIMLRRAGITDVTVYEKAESVGGTWRDNTYPGLACDVPSRFYQFTFAPKPDWSPRTHWPFHLTGLAINAAKSTTH